MGTNRDLGIITCGIAYNYLLENVEGSLAISLF